MMIFTRRLTLTLCAFVTLALSPLHAQPKTSSAPFTLSLKKDITSTAAVLTVYTGAVLYEKLNSSSDWNGMLYDKSSLNGFDAFFMHPYNDGLNTLSNVTVGAADVLPYLAVAAPLLITGIQQGKNEQRKGTYDDYRDFTTATVIYAESLVYAHAINYTLKTFISRARPFMYYDSLAPSDRLSSGDWDRSFPSGHTAMAFAGAVCGSYLFCEYFPDSKWKVPVTLTSLALAGTTAVLRVTSGNHFATDVIAGAVLGSVIGVLTPLSHHASTKNTQVSILPLGFSIKHEM